MNIHANHTVVNGNIVFVFMKKNLSHYRIPPLITTCRYKRGVVISEGVVICEIYILYVIGTYAGFGLSVFLTLYDTHITTNFIVRNSI